MKKSEVIKTAIWLLLVFLSVLVPAILVATRTIQPYWSQECLNVFSQIAEIAMHALAGLLVFYAFLSKTNFGKKTDKYVLPLVIILLSLTIFSINVHIIEWVIAVVLTIVFDIKSIKEYFETN